MFTIVNLSLYINVIIAKTIYADLVKIQQNVASYSNIGNIADMT